MSSDEDRHAARSPTRSACSRARLDGIEPFFAEHGFAIVRGLYTERRARASWKPSSSTSRPGSSPASSPRGAAR